MYRSSRYRVEYVNRTTLTPFQAPLNASGNHPCSVTAVGGYGPATLDLDKATTVCMGLKSCIRNGASVQKPVHGRCIAKALPLTIGHAEHRRQIVFLREKHAEDRADG